AEANKESAPVGDPLVGCLLRARSGIIGHQDVRRHAYKGQSAGARLHIDRILRGKGCAVHRSRNGRASAASAAGSPAATPTASAAGSPAATPTASAAGSPAASMTSRAARPSPAPPSTSPPPSPPPPPPPPT